MGVAIVIGGILLGLGSVVLLSAGTYVLDKDLEEKTGAKGKKTESSILLILGIILALVALIGLGFKAVEGAFFSGTGSLISAAV